MKRSSPPSRSPQGQKEMPGSAAPPPLAKLDTLRRILQLEGKRGYDNKAVTQGLDSFLHRWREELAANGPGDLLKRLIGLGLFAPGYAGLTPAGRRAFVEGVLRGLEGLGPSPEPGSAGSLKAKITEVSSDAGVAPPSRRQPMPPGLSFDSPVAVIRGVGPRTRSRLETLGVKTVRDLLYLFPRRHIRVKSIAELVEGEEHGMVGNVWEVRVVRLGERHMQATEAIVGDETGNLRVLWFNQPFVAQTVHANDTLFVSGYLRYYRGQRTLEATGYEVLPELSEPFGPGRLVPVYPSTEGLTQRTLRRVVREALHVWLPRLEDFLPKTITQRLGLVGLQQAIQLYHHPRDEGAWAEARKRLAFDELFLTQFCLLSRKREWQQEGAGIALSVDRGLVQAFLASLPFSLTEAQERALGEILKDISGSKPMSRLLQGEVGSGKTVVALAAMLVVAANGYQAALMAPTEILAEQHFLTVVRLLKGLAAPVRGEYERAFYLDPLPQPLTLGLLVGSMRKRAKEEMQGRTSRGEVDLVVGTQALLQGGVELPRLALAVVDEQHRFGVTQRRTLREKGNQPHLLAMSATPIPRTLALTLYGDLDLSALDELPPGRQRVRTRWLRPDQRDAAYAFIRRQVQQGRQAFVLCPLIQESEVLQTRAAQEEYERLRLGVFSDLRLDILHGRMSLREKVGSMERFRQGETDILVATPVVEVGVDIPNATVMLIEGADRFGLSELHQMRGRVGRGEHPSYCLLLSDDPSAEARERLLILEREFDGFRVAEEDLRLRGPGEVFGTRQSGLPDLRVARLSDQELLVEARTEAARLLEQDPSLGKLEHRLLAAEVKPFLRTMGELTEIS